LSDHYVIVGLGNPGAKYAKTRHNAGFWFLDRLADRSGATFRLQSKFNAEVAKASLSGKDCILVRPSTFMNHCGQAVRAVVDYYRTSSDGLLIAYDELDLPPGVARLKQGGGHPGFKDAVTGYVLSHPARSQEVLIQSALSDAVDVMIDVLNGDVSKAMKELHTATASQDSVPGKGST